MTKRFYALIEIEVDITGNPSNDEIRRKINEYLAKGKSMNGNDFYFQGDRTVAIHDEKGNNLMEEFTRRTGIEFDLSDLRAECPVFSVQRDTSKQCYVTLIPGDLKDLKLFIDTDEEEQHFPEVTLEKNIEGYEVEYF